MAAAGGAEPSEERSSVRAPCEEEPLSGATGSSSSSSSSSNKSSGEDPPGVAAAISKEEECDDSPEETTPEQHPETPQKTELERVAAAVALAKAHKCEGNEHFKEGRHAEAEVAYGAGLDALAGATLESTTRGGEEDDEDETVLEVEITEAKASLAANRAVALLKLERFRDAEKAATDALDVQPENAKALYRRGVARSKLGRYDAAFKDLSKVLAAESTNRDAKREWLFVKEKLATKRSAEKKQAARAFKMKGLSLYEDVEEARRKKQFELKQKNDLKRRRHADFNAMRAEKGETAVSFDEWVKSEEEAEKKREDDEKKTKEREQRERDERRRLARLKDGVNNEVVKIEEDEDLGEDDLVRGYKVLADGRKTSYFTRVPDDAASDLLLRDAGPRKVVAQPTVSSSSSSSSFGGGEDRDGDNKNAGDLAAGGRPLEKRSASGSAWNAAGTTFEERSCTAWADDALKRHLLAVRCQNSTDDDDGKTVKNVITVKIVNVKNLNGEASVVIARGRPRYIFDYAATLEWTATLRVNEGRRDENVMDTDDNVSSADSSAFAPVEWKGTVAMPEISSTVTSGTYEQNLKHSSKSPRHDRDRLDAALPKLRDAIDAAILAFVDEYRAR